MIPAHDGSRQETSERTRAVPALAWLTGLLFLLGPVRAGEPHPWAPLPEGYVLLYQQDFADPRALEDFEFSDPEAWRWTAGDAARPGALELHRQSRYTPRVRSPLNLALIRHPEFGDFVLEVEMLSTAREYGHRDLCVFFAAKDPANFYYGHLASRADPNAHNIFLVNDAPRTNIATCTTPGVRWGESTWHRVRVERTLADGRIRVYFDNFAEPIMEATDRHLDYGRVGFGSFDDTGRFARIRVWGPGPAPRREGFFR